ncbi:unnamed protein product [Miscanthus lutarioriparius]|uniref:Secreted protein n=1 Tax=Miscanthus lutarioriparius TaxID=422564 RepID=A0A811RWH9_9POAL|nr:unnamed protein product [Miscanthus lutarioriparius]
MRSVAACTPLICALLLLVLHCLVRAPSLAPVDRDGAASGERLRFQPRKLLRVADAMAAAGTQPLNAAAAAATAAGESRGVGASLKKQTPSRSNPRQN